MKPSRTGHPARWGAIALIAVATVTSCTDNMVPESSPGAEITANTVTVVPPDGGSNFYGQFTDGLPTSPDFFPIGVWSESVVDDTGWPRDRATGLNLYVAPVLGTDPAIIAKAGMYSLPVPGGIEGPKAGFTVADEVDMWAGPNDLEWSGAYPGDGQICTQPNSWCGYTVMEQLTADLPEDRMLYTNYGKGVVFWETAEQAGRFVNDYQDVVSADAYWFTDPSICGQTEAGAFFGTGEVVADDTCRRASNYGATVAHVRSLVAPPGSKPVWAFVEVGHPFEKGGQTITADQIRGAVWSSLINGARGVVYFNHSFGGNCPTQHVLRDCDAALTKSVGQVNRQITELARVLNAPGLENAITADGETDIMTKVIGNELYLFTGSTVNDAQDVKFTLACAGADNAVVVGEDRSIAIRDNTFSDTFENGNAVHIYQIRDTDLCGITR